MSSKSSNPGTPTKGVPENVFLLECIKAAKNKLEPDFDVVSKATGLSKGGAQNKWRFLLKKLEAESTTLTQDGAAPTPKKASGSAKGAAKKRGRPVTGAGNSTNDDALSDVDSKEDCHNLSGADEAPAKKKQKAGVAAKTTKAAVKGNHDGYENENEAEAEDDAVGIPAFTSATKSKPKASPAVQRKASSPGPLKFDATEEEQDICIVIEAPDEAK